MSERYDSSGNRLDLVTLVATNSLYTNATFYATSNTTQQSSGTIALSNVIVRGAGNVSAGITNGSIVVSATGGAGGGIAAAAGSQTATSGTVVFVNSNGITFGMSNTSQITAQHNGITSQSNAALSGSNGSFTFQTATFGNSNGLTFYTTNGSMVGSHNALTSQSNQQVTLYATSNTTQSTSGTKNASSLIFAGAGVASVGVTNGSVVVSAPAQTAQPAIQSVSAGTTRITTGEVVFSNLNGISFGADGQTITASHNGLTGAILSAGVSSLGNTGGQTGLVNRSLILVGSNNITLSQGTDIAGAATVTIFGQDQSNVGISAANGSYTYNTLVLGDGGGVSFSTTNAGPVNLINAFQSNQQLTLYATSNTTQSSSGTSNASSLIFAGAGNASVGITNGSVVISVSGGGAGDGYNILAAGSQTANTTGTVAFLNSNGISFGMSNSSQITATVKTDYLESQYGQVVSASNGSFPFQTIYFVNSNGISFGTSALASLTASHNGITSQSNQQMTLFATGNTTQSSTGTSNASSLIFNGAGIVSLGVSNGSIVISATQSNQAVTTPTGSFTFQTLELANDNGISVGTKPGPYVTFSHNALTSQSNQAVSGSNGSFTFQTVTFGNLNGASFYTSNGSMVLSYTTPAGGAYSAGISTQGNTAGTTGFAQSQLLFVGSNNITLSQSVNLGSATLSILGGGGVGGGISVFNNHPVPLGMATGNQQANIWGGGANSTQGTFSFHIFPMPLFGTLLYDQIQYPIGYATAAGTGSATNCAWFALYTKTVSTLNLVSSWQHINLLSQNSVTAQTWAQFWGTNSTSNSSGANGNISASYTNTRPRLLQISNDATLGPDNYIGVAGVWNRTAGANVAAMVVGYMVSEQGYPSLWVAQSFGQNTTGPPPTFPLGIGTFGASFATSNYPGIAPASFNITIITSTAGSSQIRQPVVFMLKTR